MGQINLTLAAHYCGDELKKTEITVSPESHSCCDVPGEHVPPPPCCHDHFSTSESDDFFGKTDFQVDLTPEFALAYVLVFEALIPKESSTTQALDYTVDQSTPDLCILNQTFRI